LKLNNYYITFTLFIYINLNKMAESSEFINVINVTKPRRLKTTIPKKAPVNLSYSDLAEIVYSKLIIYKSLIIGAFIYGSRARGTNRPDSDADIIVFWKHENDVEFLKSVRDSIEETLGFKIDFVSCVYKNRWITHVDGRDLAYFENVTLDAKPVIGKECINYLIDHSVKLPKLPKFS
jgi:predicted nucleotidyltransferase